MCKKPCDARVASQDGCLSLHSVPRASNKVTAGQFTFWVKEKEQFSDWNLSQGLIKGEFFPSPPPTEDTINQ